MNRPWEDLGRSGLALMAALTLALGGCAGLAQKLGEHLVQRSLKHEHAVQLFEGDAARFRQCLKSRGGSCPEGPGAIPHSTLPEGAGEATAALSATGKATVEGLDANHPARLAASALDCAPLSGATRLYSHLRGLPTGSDHDLKAVSGEDGRTLTLTLAMSVRELQRCHDTALRALAAGGWGSLEGHLAGQLGRAAAGTREHRHLIADHRRAAFVKTYVDAYFSNGHFIAVDLEVDEATAIAKLTHELEQHPTLCSAFNAAEAAAGVKQPPSGAASDASPCASFAQSIYRGVLGKTLGSGKPLYLLRARPVGFAPRDGGARVQFPEIDVDLDPIRRPVLSLTYGGPAGSDRFDSAFWLPVGTELMRVILEAVFDAHEGLPAASGDATGLRVPAYPLEDLADLTDAANLQQHLDKMRQVNQGVAAGVGVVLDRLIRGIGPFSLNNEALEQLIVTVVTTSVQKAMEKATWCYYACDLNTAIEAAEKDLEKAAEAGARKLGGHLASYAHEATEKVRLHLEIAE